MSQVSQEEYHEHDGEAQGVGWEGGEVELDERGGCVRSIRGVGASCSRGLRRMQGDQAASMHGKKNEGEQGRSTGGRGNYMGTEGRSWTEFQSREMMRKCWYAGAQCENLVRKEDNVDKGRLKRIRRRD
eukprot:767768-Hanusia_phi.AAC.3